MFYQAKVKVEIPTDNGKIKSKTYVHVVEDTVISGVENQIGEVYHDSVHDWELVSVSETKIVSIIRNNEEV